MHVSYAMDILIKLLERRDEYRKLLQELPTTDAGPSFPMGEFSYVKPLVFEDISDDHDIVVYDKDEKNGT